MLPPTDRIPCELIVAAQRGDAEALRELYGHIRALVGFIILAVVGRRPGIEQLGDAICEDIVLNLGTFTPGGAFASWVGRAATWRSRRWLRTECRRERTHAEARAILPVAAESPDVASERNELLVAADVAMRRMPPRLLACFALVDLAGEKPADATKIIGGNPREIANSAYRGRLLLRRELANMGLVESKTGSASASPTPTPEVRCKEEAEAEPAEGGGVHDAGRATG